MTIKLLVAIQGAGGVEIPAGTEVTLTDAVEAAHVSANKAVYTTQPMTFDAPPASGVGVKINPLTKLAELMGPNGEKIPTGSPSITSMVPSDYYHVALRASQAGNGSPVDQSGKLHDPVVNTALFPPARANSTAYTLGQYRSPSALNGRLFKCTTAGTSGASEPTWNTTIGGTTTDGTAVWTCEQGPWGNSAAGYRHIIALESASLGQLGAIEIPALTWDMAKGDSLIIRIRQAWGWQEDSRADLSESKVFGNRHASTNRRGFSISAGPNPYRSLKFTVSDGTNSVTSGELSSSFTRRPGDGQLRETLIAVDGIQKMSFGWADGVAYGQPDMYNASNYPIHNRSLAAVTGSTATTNSIFIGRHPGDTTSNDFGIIALDILVLPGRSLPTNMQAIADWFYSRGAESLLPASLIG